MQERILRIREVEQMVGITKPGLYQRMKAGTFPKSVKIGPRAIGWRLSEIEKWIKNLK